MLDELTKNLSGSIHVYADVYAVFLDIVQNYISYGAPSICLTAMYISFAFQPPVTCTFLFPRVWRCSKCVLQCCWSPWWHYPMHNYFSSLLWQNKECFLGSNPSSRICELDCSKAPAGWWLELHITNEFATTCKYLRLSMEKNKNSKTVALHICNKRSIKKVMPI